MTTKKDKISCKKQPQHPSKTSFKMKLVMAACVLVVLAVAIFYATLMPGYTAEQNAALAERLNASSCNTETKVCLFDNSRVLCQYKMINAIPYLGNCFVRGV